MFQHKTSVPAVANELQSASNQATTCRAFLTTAEVQAEILPLSRRAIYDLRKKGIIPAIESGGKVLFHRESVIAALVRRQRGGSL